MSDSTWTVERSVTVDAPPAVVYEQIADFRRWAAWSPWEGIDPQMSRTYAGAASGVGSVYAWSGNRRAGQGRMTITEAVEPSTVRIDLVFDKPFKARNDTVLTVRPEGGGSRVTWTMTGRRTLATRVMSAVQSMDTLLGRDFEKGLGRLRSVAEDAAR